MENNEKDIKIVTQFQSGEVTVGLINTRKGQTPQWAVWIWLRKCTKAGVKIDHIGYSKGGIYSFAGWESRPNKQFLDTVSKVFS